MRITRLDLDNTKLRYIISLSDEDIETIKDGGDVSSFCKFTNGFIMVCKENDEI